MFSSNDNLLKRAIIKLIIVISLALIVAVSLGVVLAKINNMENIESLLETNKPSLPSKLLDRNGELITEFYSDEKRDIVTLDTVPDFLIQALIIWEDSSFYKHYGFNPMAIFRAAINNALGKAVSGASTLTQQLARTLFLTNEFSINRKIKELWISIQLEKKYTKNELLTLYINHVPFGYGTNGVQAASKQFFNKDVTELTYAEAAALITVISNPTFYSFNKFPSNHKKKQKEVLRRMVKFGIIREVDMEHSFNEFWLQWQQTAQSTRGAFYNREDKAPFFSDWVLQEIERKLPSVNVFKDGLTIYSTLDLKSHLIAEKLMAEIFDTQQKIFEQNQIRNYNAIQNKYLDSIVLMSELFSLSSVNIDQNRDKQRAITEFQNNLNPALNLTSQVLGLNLLETLTDVALEQSSKTKNLIAQVQGAFIALENETGQILVMVGGKTFDPNNRFNYAMQSRRQPGSSFKPLIYSAALDSGMYTASSIIIDKPFIFTFDSEDPDDWYKPNNYGGAYYDKVTFRRALRKSLNIPSCQIFYALGKNNNYKVPIDRAALLLGINSQKEINERFKPEVSTVLGTGSVSPLEMAEAFSVFANLGSRKITNSILYVEDRDGSVIYEPWKDIQKYHRENSKKLQVISQQNAFIITNILRDTVHHPDGFLTYRKNKLIEEGKTFPKVELAAKTGTTQNFNDAWIVGFSPEITVSMWCGFKEYGLSLGIGQPGVSVHGNAFLDFMRLYHFSKEPLTFKKPDNVAQVKVCSESGMLPSEDCSEETQYYEYFIPGTVPKTTCTVCKLKNERERATIDKFMKKYEIIDSKTDFLKFDIKYNDSFLKQNETNTTEIDIEGLTTVNLFEDDSYTNIDNLLNDSKKNNNSDKSKNENITDVTSDNIITNSNQDITDDSTDININISDNTVDSATNKTDDEIIEDNFSPTNNNDNNIDNNNIEDIDNIDVFDSE